MSQPQVVNVPANQTVQIPLDGSGVTVLNLNNTLGLTLCTDGLFNASTSWPLPSATSLPLVGMNNLWVHNPNTTEISVLVMPGIIPVSYAPANSSGPALQSVLGGLAKLTTLTANEAWYISGYATNGVQTLVFNWTIITGTGNVVFSTAANGGGIVLASTPITALSETLSFDTSQYTTIFISLTTGGSNITVTSWSLGSITTISPPQPQSTTQVITYTITQTGSGTTPITDATGAVLGTINNAQAPGTYTTTVPIVTTGAAITIAPPSNAYLKVAAAYNH